MTTTTATFWDGNHPRQNEYSKAWDQLVPAQGPAPTIQGELLRIAGRLIYEYGNNGNCNVAEPYMQSCGCNWDPDCWECGGENEIEGEIEIKEHWAEFFDYLLEHAPNTRQEVEAIQEFITHESGVGLNPNYTAEESKPYDILMLKVLDYIALRPVATYKTYGKVYAFEACTYDGEKAVKDQHGNIYQVATSTKYSDWDSLWKVNEDGPWSEFEYWNELPAALQHLLKHGNLDDF